MSHNAQPSFHSIDTLLTPRGLGTHHSTSHHSTLLIATIHHKFGLNAETMPNDNNFMMRTRDGSDIILHVTKDKDLTKTQLYFMNENYKVVIDCKKGDYCPLEVKPMRENELSDLRRINFNSNKKAIIHPSYLIQLVDIHRQNRYPDHNMV